MATADELLTEAQKGGGHRTKEDTVDEALEEYIQRSQQTKGASCAFAGRMRNRFGSSSPSVYPDDWR